MSSYQHESLKTLKQRTFRISALISALSELVENRSIENDGPVIGLIETLESEAGEVNDIINMLISGGSKLEVKV